MSVCTARGRYGHCPGGSRVGQCSCEPASRHRRARAHEGVAQPQLVGGQHRCGCERQAADEQRHGQRHDASESALRGYLLLAESYEGTGGYQIKFKRL